MTTAGPFMNGYQRRLARQALGLDQSHHGDRNRFVAENASPEWDAWFDMVEGGFATVWSAGPAETEFRVTAAGARLALDPGNTLAPSLFQEAPL